MRRDSNKRSSIKDPKKDNISSRLLGTNVNEINIEKFRDPREQKPNFNLRGRLTQELLKSISNKFSTDVIFNLNISHQNLTNVDALANCPNLVMLNLKNNEIRDLTPLSNCKSLVYLNCQLNEIQYLEPLKKCEKLANLHAEGNRIIKKENLKGLEFCQNLRTVYFKTLSGLDQNEICKTPNYKTEVYIAIPSLQRLDGIPKNVILDNGEGLVEDQKDIDFKIDQNNPWYTHSFQKANTTKPLIFLGEETFKDTVKDCKSEISALEAKIKALML